MNPNYRSSFEAPIVDGPGTAVPSSSSSATLHLRPALLCFPGTSDPIHTCLLPANFTYSGGLQWNFNLAPPSFAQIHFRFAGQHNEALEVFPTTPYQWPPPPSPGQIMGGLGMGGMGMMNPPNPFTEGNLYAGNYLCPPVDPVNYVVQYFLPRFRPASRIVSVEQLPSAAESARLAALEPGVSTSASAARIELSEPTGYKEQLFLALVYSSVSGPMGTTTFWRPHVLYSFRAPISTFSSSAPVLSVIMQSLKPTPRFLTLLKQLGDDWIAQGFRRSQAALDLSHHLSRINDEMIAMNRASWQKKMESDDRISRNFSEAIRGVERWSDGGREVELPNGYSAAWRNEFGEYIVSQNTMWDPNSGGLGGGNWTRLGKVS